MISFLKSLFARSAGGGEASDEPVLDAVEYKGYRIRPAPYAAKGGFQTAGTIERDGPEDVREHRFIRAETHPSRDDAAAYTIAKAQRIIDEQGERLFGG